MTDPLDDFAKKHPETLKPKLWYVIEPPEKVISKGFAKKDLREYAVAVQMRPNVDLGSVVELLQTLVDNLKDGLEERPARLN